MALNRKIRYGMVGGGRGAFIGAVHRIAAAIDQQVELVCGAFSSDPERSKASGADLFLPPDRCYGSFEEMIKAEAALPADQRMDFVAIVTPNHMHFPPAKMALENGFHVLSDKPATLNLKEAKELAAIVKKSGLIYGLTHNYTGYPLVKQARDMIKEGKLGKIRKVVVEYPQGWLATRLEESGQKQAAWRTDPKKSGAGGCVGDIGTHAENLAEYITGLKIKELAADITSFVKGRKLDDDANVLLRFQGGAKGVLHSSQISVGEENNLNIRVYGEKAGLEWRQDNPNYMWFTEFGKPKQLLTRGGAISAPPPQEIHAASPPATPRATSRPSPTSTRKPSAPSKPNSRASRSRRTSTIPTSTTASYGMAFIETVVKSSKLGAKWVKFPKA
jgi:predicted dehydrogenase